MNFVVHAAFGSETPDVDVHVTPALLLVKTGRPTLAQYGSALSTVALGRTVPEFTD